MILHTPLPKLVILGRQGLETWENRGREVGEPNEREKGGELCKNAYYFGAIEKGLPLKGESQEKRSRNRKYKVFCSNTKTTSPLDSNNEQILQTSDYNFFESEKHML